MSADNRLLLVEAVGLTLEGNKPPLKQVAARLGAKPILLVLDNFEHLLDGAALLTDILKTCPELTLLVTSRERLNLKEEWLFPLEGLTFSPQTPLLAVSRRTPTFYRACQAASAEIYA